MPHHVGHHHHHHGHHHHHNPGLHTARVLGRAAGHIANALAPRPVVVYNPPVYQTPVYAPGYNYPSPMVVSSPTYHPTVVYTRPWNRYDSLKATGITALIIGVALALLGALTFNPFLIGGGVLTIAAGVTCLVLNHRYHKHLDTENT